MCVGVLPVHVSLCTVLAEAGKGGGVRILGRGVTEPP